jgi:hypothetical protein
LLWAKQAGGTAYHDWGHGIATDGAGNSLVTGSFAETATFGAGEAHETSLTSTGRSDIFVAKYGPEEPTAVSLTFFSAQAGADGVTLAWETATEVDNAGFNLYRALTQDGPWTQINDGLIPAKGDPVSGASYSFVDRPHYGTYYYQLEDVDYHGVSTQHGPVRVTLARPVRRPLYRPRLPQF